MNCAAVFFADGFEEIEALAPVDFLRRAGVKVITVGVKGKVLENEFVVTSSHNVQILTDMTLKKYLNEFSDSVDCLICPGGSAGADNLADCEILTNHLENSWEKGKIIAAICASPAVVLGKTEILHNKKWTCYPGMQDNAKKDFLNGYENKTFVVDGNLITARGPGASEEFAMEIVKKMCGKEVFNKIRSGTQQTAHSESVL